MCCSLQLVNAECLKVQPKVEQPGAALPNLQGRIVTFSTYDVLSDKAYGVKDELDEE